MNVFEAVKPHITTRQAAEMYGIKVNRHGMAVCPFHNDNLVAEQRNEVMKLEQRFAERRTEPRHKKDGLYLDKHIRFFYRAYFVRNTDRPYRTQNMYVLLEKEEKFNKEVEKIIFKGKTPEQIKELKNSGEKSEIKIAGRKMIIPVKGPVDYRTKKELEKAVKKAKLRGSIPELRERENQWLYPS